MHPEAYHFLHHVSTLLPEYFRGCRVLDVGGGDINGNNCSLFDKQCSYTANDVAEGKNVSIVCRTKDLPYGPEFFDTIISSECFEHDAEYPQSLKKIGEMLRQGGLFVFTCATTGRKEHGTRRTTPEDSLATSASVPCFSDYYKNLTATDVDEAMDVIGTFETFRFYDHGEHHDLFFWGIKKGGPPRKPILDMYEAPSVRRVLLRPNGKENHLPPSPSPMAVTIGEFMEGLPKSPRFSMATTVVTCLYRVHPEHYCPVESYLQLGEWFSDLRVPMVIFTTEQLRPHIKNIRKGLPTHIVVMPLTETLYFQRDLFLIRQRIEEHTIDNRDPVKDTAEAVALYNSKLFFLRRAIEENVFGSTHMAWCDFGIAKNVSVPCALQLILERGDVPDRISHCVLQPFLIPKERLLRYFYHHIAGSFFVGSTENLLWYADAFDKEWRSVLYQENAYQMDEAIMTLCVEKYPERFRLYYGDYESLFCNFYRAISLRPFIMTHVSKCLDAKAYNKANEILDYLKPTCLHHPDHSTEYLRLCVLTRFYRSSSTTKMDTDEIEALFSDDYRHEILRLQQASNLQFYIPSIMKPFRVVVGACPVSGMGNTLKAFVTALRLTLDARVENTPGYMMGEWDTVLLPRALHDGSNDDDKVLRTRTCRHLVLLDEASEQQNLPNDYPSYDGCGNRKLDVFFSNRVLIDWHYDPKLLADRMRESISATWGYIRDVLLIPSLRDDARSLLPSGGFNVAISVRTWKGEHEQNIDRPYSFAAYKAVMDTIMDARSVVICSDDPNATDEYVRYWQLTRGVADVTILPRLERFNALQWAVVQALVLSESKKYLVGNRISTFTEAVWWLSGCRLEVKTVF